MSKPLEHGLGEAPQGHNSKLTDSSVNANFYENYLSYTTEIKVASDNSNDHNSVLLSHKDSFSMPVANEYYVNDEHNYVSNMYSNRQPFMSINTCMHVPWDDSQSDSPQVACMEPPHLGVPPNWCLNLHTVDVTNTWFYLESDNSDNYYVYIHRNNFVAQEGFLHIEKLSDFLGNGCLRVHMSSHGSHTRLGYHSVTCNFSYKVYEYVL